MSKAIKDAKSWGGVFPAATTQFYEDMSVDLAATKAVVDGLIRDGVHGIIAMGTVGENNSLLAAENAMCWRRLLMSWPGAYR